MKFSLLAAAAIAPMVSAYYFFDTLVIMTPDVLDFRCNKGAFSFADTTGTAEVKAGSNLALKLVVSARMQHPGPALAPSTAKQYQGDGEWFKIY
ncbi:hypothetical protein N7516_010467 [Penicillium verrucosum]|uniref:uncharacterized protein n=1 Tax=Penicillium verrucosum TaxID=60171 RepID=UPI002545586F|nr:uncharacterized protein N7516_010467 [Penicillium verrucosum]KAJ5922764.1 hypothetical protein N7516_010467 [Penicillium verrucosum]